jgi:hypothetical protein
MKKLALIVAVLATMVTVPAEARGWRHSRGAGIGFGLAAGALAAGAYGPNGYGYRPYGYYGGPYAYYGGQYVGPRRYDSVGDIIKEIGSPGQNPGFFPEVYTARCVLAGSGIRLFSGESVRPALDCSPSL